MKVVKITCDLCKKQIVGDRYKIGAFLVTSEQDKPQMFKDCTSKTDFCENCVRKLLKVEDLAEKDTTSGKRQKLDIAKVVELKDSGMTFKEVADELGYNSASITTAYYKYKKENSQNGENENEPN